MKNRSSLTTEEIYHLLKEGKIEGFSIGKDCELVLVNNTIHVRLKEE